jgi:hypothetical protein
MCDKVAISSPSCRFVAILSTKYLEISSAQHTAQHLHNTIPQRNQAQRCVRAARQRATCWLMCELLVYTHAYTCVHYTIRCCAEMRMHKDTSRARSSTVTSARVCVLAICHGSGYDRQRNDMCTDAGKHIQSTVIREQSIAQFMNTLTCISHTAQHYPATVSAAQTAMTLRAHTRLSVPC